MLGHPIVWVRLPLDPPTHSTTTLNSFFTFPDLSPLPFFLLWSVVLAGSEVRLYISGGPWLFSLLKDVAETLLDSHWLYLFDFSPVCIFRCGYWEPPCFTLVLFVWPFSSVHFQMWRPRPSLVHDQDARCSFTPLSFARFYPYILWFNIIDEGFRIGTMRANLYQLKPFPCKNITWFLDFFW